MAKGEKTKELWKNPKFGKPMPIEVTTWGHNFCERGIIK